MSDCEGPQLTRLIQSAGKGDEESRDRLFSIVYDELRRIASRRRGVGKFGHTMQPTALVNEAYLFFEKRSPMLSDHEIENREIFFRVFAFAMRAVLKDYWRKKQSRRAGAGKPPAPLEDQIADAEPDSDFGAVDFLALDEALDCLEHENGRWFEVVMHRYFGGRTREETAKIMGLSEATVKRDWKIACAWLRRKLLAEDAE